MDVIAPKGGPVHKRQVLHDLEQGRVTRRQDAQEGFYLVGYLVGYLIGDQMDDFRGHRIGRHVRRRLHFPKPSSIAVSKRRAPWMTLMMITRAPAILKMVRYWPKI